MHTEHDMEMSATLKTGALAHPSIRIESITSRIETLIWPWARCKTKPPFSPEELVVMALASTKIPMYELDIANWIMDHCPYYAAIARREFFSPSHRHTSLGRKAACDDEDWDCCFPKRLSAVLLQFEVPVKEIELSVSDEEDGDEEDEQLWITSAPEARIFLHDRIQTSLNGVNTTDHFPFMRLPPELRLTIYELVFGFPRSGIFLELERKSLHVFARSYQGLGDSDDTENSRTLNCRPPTEALALLQTNKQIFQEAVPVFYNINTIVCLSVKELDRFLLITPESRRKHIRHIRFYYVPSDADSAASAFRRLKMMKHLQRLDIDIDGEEWLEHKNSKDKQVYPDLLKLPGLATLRSVRGLRSVTFDGDCEAVREHLAAEMVKPKPVKRSSDGGKKRKAAGNERGGKSGGKSKSKKAAQFHCRRT